MRQNSRPSSSLRTEIPQALGVELFDCLLLAIDRLRHFFTIHAGVGGRRAPGTRRRPRDREHRLLAVAAEGRCARLLPSGSGGGHLHWHAPCTAANSPRSRREERARVPAAWNRRRRAAGAEGGRRGARLLHRIRRVSRLSQFDLFFPHNAQSAVRQSTAKSPKPEALGGPIWDQGCEMRMRFFPQRDCKL